MKSVAIITLGCPKNLVDSEIIAGHLEREGYTLKDEREADIVIINTCAFIEDAIRESIETILETANDKGGRKLVVAGCLPQRFGGTLKELIPEVDLWIGLNQLLELPLLIRGGRPHEIEPASFLPSSHLPRKLLTPSVTTYLKTAEGCNNKCTYCTIPSIRGNLRSRTIHDLVREAEHLAEEGMKEVNLVAQDLTRYGEDLGYKNGLIKLIDRLEKIDGIRWIRLLYLHPAGVTKEIAERLGMGKVVSYLEMPIQHVNEKVLKAMGRRGGKRAIMKAIEQLESVKDLYLRTTVMVGFPGEGEEEFQELLRFLEEAPIFRLGAFAYSPEDGTPAYSMNQVDVETKRDRLSQILALQEEIHLCRNQALVGKEISVLVEEKNPKESISTGRFFGQAPEIDGVVYINEMPHKELITVKITDTDSVDLYGKTRPPRNPSA